MQRMPCLAHASFTQLGRLKQDNCQQPCTLQELTLDGLDVEQATRMPMRNLPSLVLTTGVVIVPNNVEHAATLGMVLANTCIIIGKSEVKLQFNPPDYPHSNVDRYCPEKLHAMQPLIQRMTGFDTIALANVNPVTSTMLATLGQVKGECQYVAFLHCTWVWAQACSFLQWHRPSQQYNVHRKPARCPGTGRHIAPGTVCQRQPLVELAHQLEKRCTSSHGMQAPPAHRPFQNCQHPHTL